MRLSNCAREALLSHFSQLALSVNGLEDCVFSAGHATSAMSSLKKEKIVKWALSDMSYIRISGKFYVSVSYTSFMSFPTVSAWCLNLGILRTISRTAISAESKSFDIRWDSVRSVGIP